MASGQSPKVFVRRHQQKSSFYWIQLWLENGHWPRWLRQLPSAQLFYFEPGLESKTFVYFEVRKLLSWVRTYAWCHNWIIKIGFSKFAWVNWSSCFSSWVDSCSHDFLDRGKNVDLEPIVWVPMDAKCKDEFKKFKVSETRQLQLKLFAEKREKNHFGEEFRKSWKEVLKMELGDLQPLGIHLASKSFHRLPTWQTSLSNAFVRFSIFFIELVLKIRQPGNISRGLSFILTGSLISLLAEPSKTVSVTSTFHFRAKKSASISSKVNFTFYDLETLERSDRWLSAKPPSRRRPLSLQTRAATNARKRANQSLGWGTETNVRTKRPKMGWEAFQNILTMQKKLILR